MNSLTEEISSVLEKLTMATKNLDKNEDDSFFLIFKPIILSLTDTLRNIKNPT